MKVNTTGTTITFTFDGLDAITFDAAKASPEMRLHAEMDRWQNRLRDNAAIPRKTKPGAPVITITEQMRRDAVAELVTHYESGATEWNIGGRTRAAPQNPTILAIATRLGVSYAEAEAEVAKRMLDEMA